MPTVPAESPRITALRQQLDAGDERALLRFWDEMAERGTPLVELIADDPAGRYLLTFLWRGNAETRTVVISSLSWPPGGRAESALTRLADTDVWHSRPFTVQPDHRTIYAIVVNDPEEKLTAHLHAIPDPLNRHPFAVPQDEEHPEFVRVFGPRGVLSTAVLPKAPAQPWIEVVPDVPKGRVELHRFRSETFGNERRVWVYTPPGYDRLDECWLLLAFDGWLYLHVNRTPTVLDNLLAAGKIPPTVAVLFDSPETLAVRTQELKFNPALLDCVATELMPWLAAHYRFAADPARRIIAGTSLGGLAAAFVALRLPSLFGNVLCQSGCFQFALPGQTEYEHFVRMIAAEPRLPLRFWLDAGRLEGLVAGFVVVEDQNPGIFVATRHLRTVLEAKGYEVHYREFSGAHDFASWPGTFPEALIALTGSQET